MSRPEKYIINEKIKYPELRVVSKEGNQLGVMNTGEALEMARTDNLDLIIITEQANPPVAKIVEYSKFKYELGLRAKENAKKNRLNKVELKEITLRLNTDDADFNRLMIRTTEWIDRGNKVKINLNLRGRENHHKQEGRDFLTKFIEGVPNAVIEGKIGDANRGLSVIVIGKK